MGFWFLTDHLLLVLLKFCKLKIVSSTCVSRPYKRGGGVEDPMYNDKLRRAEKI